MFRDKVSIPRKIKTAIIISLVLFIWMLIALLQLGGVKMYAFILMFITVLTSHGLIAGLFLKNKAESRLLAIGVLLLNVFIVFLGMVLSAVFKDDTHSDMLDLIESKCVAISEGQEFDYEKNGKDIPKVILSNASNGVKMTWEPIEGAQGYVVFRKDDNTFRNIIYIMDSAITSYTDTTAISGTEYTYVVCAFQENETGRYIPQTFSSGVWKPTISVAGAEDDVTVKWTKIEGVDSYHLYRKEANGSYEEIAVIDAIDDLEYKDSSVVYGIKYTYGIRAYIGEKRSGLATKEITLNLNRTELKAQCISDGSNEGIRLNWEKVEGAEGYNIYRKKNGEKYKKISTVEKDVTEWFDGDVLEESEYFYTVRATKKDYMNKCTAVSVTTDKFPEKQKILAASLERVTVELEEQNSKVSLKWNVVDGAQGYHIYRKIDNGEYVLISTVDDASKNNFADETVEKGKQYLYYVCAFIGSQEGVYTGAKIEVK